VKRGDVSWVGFDPARGGEIRKRRPAVVVSNDSSNRRLNRVGVVPLTSKTERLYPSRALVDVGGTRQKAMADQIRTVAKERLRNYVASMSDADLLAVEQAPWLQPGLP
jgi:mRNA interferase MazF